MKFFRDITGVVAKKREKVKPRVGVDSKVKVKLKIQAEPILLASLSSLFKLADLNCINFERQTLMRSSKEFFFFSAIPF